MLGDTPVYEEQAQAHFRHPSGHWESNLAELLLSLPCDQAGDAITQWTKSSMVSLLVKSGWDPTVIMSNGMLPITYALQSGQYDLASKLLSFRSPLFSFNAHAETYLIELAYILSARHKELSNSLDGRKTINHLKGKFIGLCEIANGSGELSPPCQYRLWKLVLEHQSKLVAGLLLRHDLAFSPNMAITDFRDGIPASTLWWQAVASGLINVAPTFNRWLSHGADAFVSCQGRNLFSAVTQGLNVNGSAQDFWQYCQLLNILHGQLGLTLPVDGNEFDKFQGFWENLKDLNCQDINDYEELALEVKRVDIFLNKVELDRGLPASKPVQRLVKSKKL